VGHAAKVPSELAVLLSRSSVNAVAHSVHTQPSAAPGATEAWNRSLDELGGGVLAVPAIVVLATYAFRLALVILLVVATPICLVRHVLPRTEGLARLWWRTFVATLAVQVAQSLVLVTALRVFLPTDSPANLGIASTRGLVDLLVSVCLCWVIVKILSWVSRMVFSSSRSHGGASRVIRDVIAYKGVKALAAKVGL